MKKITNENEIQSKIELSNAILEKIDILNNFINIIKTSQTNGTIKYLDMEYNPANKPNSKTDYGTVEVVPKEKTYTVESHQVSATATFEQIKQLDEQFGIDAIAMLKNSLVQEQAINIIKNGIRRIKDIGAQNPYIQKTNIFKKIIKFIFKLFNKNFGEVVKIKTKGDFLRTMKAIKHKIAQNTRKGPGTYLICSHSLAAFIQDKFEEFVFASNNFATENQNQNIIFKIGTLSGLDVYVNSDMKYDDPTIYIGRFDKEDGPVLPFLEHGTSFVQTQTEEFNQNVYISTRYCLIDIKKNHIMSAKIKLHHKIKG